jgi:hypothetical protein
MPAHPTPPIAALRPGHATAQAERDADEVLEQIARARQHADTPDDAAAAAGWADIARLAGQLRRRAREIQLVAGALAGETPEDPR